ncbi:3-octaprenyl-4-hydroxybenzoate carboxy-lyase [Thermocrinis albus DSM 14484]|uniref:Flavin prenyltransferase UbiX n=2 Tax=Thermocrinis TaxID=75905 RepID=D3SL37_THEAH|nr:3-octaprenyl-4-hydroxybenzoate carboxy-lyase [Thermocrinis albus DSM 14484]
MNMQERLVVSITGASGSIYGIRLTEVLLQLGFDVDLIISSSGLLVIKEELGLTWEDLRKKFPQVRWVKEKDLTDPVASGSRLIHYRGVIIAPCSMSTLACISAGINNNLIHRVCEVALKERVPLVLLVREMPYSLIHLENMLRVVKAGAVVMPASPGFYHKPKSIEDMVDFVVGKILDALRIEHHLFRRWREPQE